MKNAQIPNNRRCTFSGSSLGEQCERTAMHSSRKSKCLHRIRTFNINLSKAKQTLSSTFGMLICFERCRMFHLVAFVLSAIQYIGHRFRAPFTWIFFYSIFCYFVFCYFMFMFCRLVVFSLRLFMFSIQSLCVPW